MNSQYVQIFSFEMLNQLLRHIPESKRNSVIDDLYRISLIEIENRDSYYLTPVFRKAVELYNSYLHNNVLKKLESLDNRTNIYTDVNNTIDLVNTASQTQKGIENMVNNSNLFLQSSNTASQAQKGIENMVSNSSLFLQNPNNGFNKSQFIGLTHSSSVLPQMQFVAPATHNLLD